MSETKKTCEYSECADAPDWAVREARKRKELYKNSNRRAYRLTSREMEDIWEAEREPEPEGIVEDFPIEEVS
jgi:hypothetical protein